MIKERIPETNEGIQDTLTVEVFDRFAKGMRDKGWNNVQNFIKAGISGGNVLELGPGPGYVGLEWLKSCPGAALTGCEISPAMIAMAQKNAQEYGLASDVWYVEGNCMEMPFPKDTFDGVISNGSLHEWEDPVKVFSEIERVLKPGGRFCIADMRRDVSPTVKWMIYASTTPKEIRPGFLTSLAAAYTPGEISEIASKTPLVDIEVSHEFFGLLITGHKRPKE